MKKRYGYALLFGIPGFFLAAIFTLFLFGVVFGTLWLFVFGDDAWPASTETILSIFVIGTFLML